MNKLMTQQECIELLIERGISVIYEPRVLMPGSRGDYGLTNMSVFEAVEKLGIWEKTNLILGHYANK